MKRLYQLKRNGNGWEFGSEASLENFIWDNLEKVFNLKPLSRQYYVDGSICDILAISDQNQLVLIELKNSEDRYVVQQVTRYYDVISNQKPLSNQIDYKNSIRLMIISPSFHKDNWTDCSYSRLSFDLCQFSISGDRNPELRLQNLRTQQEYVVEIPFALEEESIVSEVPQPSKAFETALARCRNHDPELMRNFREKILRYDRRIQESQLRPGVFLLGLGKSPSTSTSCAVLKTEKYEEKGPQEHPIFSLRLPISFRETYRFSNVSLPSNLFLRNGINWLEWGSTPNSGLFLCDEFSNFCQKGFRRTRKTTQEWGITSYFWEVLGWELRSQDIAQELNYNTVPQILENYCQAEGLPNATQSNADLLDFLLEFSLKRWVAQL
jgi:RecB family endonuclease NucS